MIHTEQGELPITPDGTLDAKSASLTKAPTLYQKLLKRAAKPAILVASTATALLLLANPSSKAEAANCTPNTPENCDPTLSPDPSCPRVNYLLVNAFGLDPQRQIIAFIPRKAILDFYQDRAQFEKGKRAIQKPETANDVPSAIQLTVETLQGGNGYASLAEVKRRTSTANGFNVEQIIDQLGRPTLKVSTSGDHNFKVTGVDQVDGEVKNLNAYGLTSQRLLTNGARRFYQNGPKVNQPEAEMLEVPFDCVCYTQSANPTHVSHLQSMLVYGGSDAVLINRYNFPLDYFPPQEALDGK